MNLTNFFLQPDHRGIWIYRQPCRSCRFSVSSGFHHLEGTSFLELEHRVSVIRGSCFKSNHSCSFCMWCWIPPTCCSALESLCSWRSGKIFINPPLLLELVVSNTIIFVVTISWSITVCFDYGGPNIPKRTVSINRIHLVSMMKVCAIFLWSNIHLCIKLENLQIFLPIAAIIDENVLDILN